MEIIHLTPNAKGAYAPIQNCNFLPSGCVELTSNCDTTPFYAHNGFVTLTVVDDLVVAMKPNLAAWEAWKAEEAAKPKPVEVPTLEERNRADIDFVAVMTGVTL